MSDEGIGSVRGHKHIWNKFEKKKKITTQKIDARSARGQMKGESALVKCVHVFFFFPEQETTFNHLPSTLSFHEILKGKTRDRVIDECRVCSDIT